MIRSLLVAAVALALVAAEPAVVPMGYGALGPDGLPRDVVVALSRAQFAALVATAATHERGDGLPALAVGPGTWTGGWRDGRWTFAGTVPLAAPGAAWGRARLAVPGTVTSAAFEALAGAPLPPQPAWRMDDGVLVLAMPPRSQAVLRLAVTCPAPLAAAASLRFPPGGALVLDLPPGVVAESGGEALATALALPGDSRPLTVAVAPPAAAVDAGSLGFEQRLLLRHLGDRVAWHAEVAIDGQRRAPAAVELVLPAGLDVLAAGGEALATWRQRDGRLGLRWSSDAPGRVRRAVLDGVIVADAGVAPLLALPTAVRGGGALAVVDAGPVRWTTPADGAGLRRMQPQDGERFRIAWDGPGDTALRLGWSDAAERLTADADGLLVVAPGRWRAELAIALAGTGLADHLTLAVPAPWRVIGSTGAAWLPAGDAVVELRAATAIAAGARLVLRCEAPAGAEGLPAIRVTDGAAVGRCRWLVADRGGLRAAASGPAADADALRADLARAGIRIEAGERTRGAVELRTGAVTALRVSPEERRAHLEAAHYLIAGAGAGRWACRLAVVPETGALERVRIRLPAGARLVDRRGEAVAAWSEADGWLTATFAAPLERPTALELAFAADWGEADGRDRLEFTALACEPAVASETVVLAEDEEAGQLTRRLDGLEERPAAAVPLPAGVAPAQLAGRAWAATGAAWKLALERERLATDLGADGVATLVDVHSAIDPDGRLVSRATWYVINRSRPALVLGLPAGCALWEVRVGGLPVRPRARAAGEVEVPVSPLRPGEAAARIQVVWAQDAAAGALRPLLPRLADLRVMRALWRFTAPPGTGLVHVDGWEPVAAGDATGARVEVLADELKRLRATGEESAAVRYRLADQLRLIDQELTDHLAVLAGLGQDAGRWTGDITMRQADAAQQQELQARNLSYNSVAIDNQQALRSTLGKLGTVARAQRDRRGGLLLDGQPIRWPQAAADPSLGPGWAERLKPEATADAPLVAAIGSGLGPGAAVASATAAAALSGVDLLPVQDGEELTLRSDGLGAQPVLRLERHEGGFSWLPALLGLGAAAALALACLRRR